MAVGLKAPNIKIDFKPSPKQYELWKLLQPDYCPHCGGHISQKWSDMILKETHNINHIAHHAALRIYHNLF